MTVKILSTQQKRRQEWLWVSFTLMLLMYAGFVKIQNIEGDSALLGKLGNAFIAGHSYLPQKPPAFFFTEPQPALIEHCTERTKYSPFTDYLFFDGKFYLPYGPVPTLISFMPYKWLTGHDLSVAFVILLWSCIGSMTVVFIYLELTDRLQVNNTAFMPMAFALLIFGTFIPITITWARQYQVCLMMAYAFIAIGLYSYLRAIRARGNFARSSKLALWGLCLGLAAGCRQHFILAGIILPMYIFYQLYVQQFRITKKWLLESACILLPWLCCLAGLLYYNQIRFGSPFTSGLQYQITCRAVTHSIGHFSVLNILHNLYFYLLHLIPLSTAFPFFNPQPAYHGIFTPPWASDFDFSTQEPIYGLINIPFVFFAAAAIPLLKRTSDNGLRMGLWFLWIIPLSIFPVLLIMTASMRYAVDFVPWLMISACIGYGYVHMRYPDYKMLRLLGGITAAYTIACNIAYAIQGY